MRTFEYGLCALLALAGLGHLGGTLAGYEPGTEIFVWSLSAVALVFTLAALHVLRMQRPADRPLALAAAVATLAWAVIALMFGQAIGDVLDPRVMMHVVVSLLLAAMAVRRPPEAADTPRAA